MNRFTCFFFAFSSFFLVFVYVATAQNCNNPYASFEFVPDSTVFCEEANGVKITVDVTADETNDPACIATMEIIWEQGLTETITNNPFGNHSHTYTFPDSLACALEGTILEITVQFRIIFTNGIPNTRGQSFRVKFLPRAKIKTDNPLCIGQPIVFSLDDDCYVDGVVWDFGGGNTSTDLSPTFTYTSEGPKTVNVCVSNECGQKCSSRQIFIRNKPVISAIHTSPASASGCQPLTVEFNPVVQNAGSYEWFLPPDCTGCFSYIDTTDNQHSNPRVRFFKPGDYTMTLIASNECGKDTSIVEVQVYDVPGVDIEPAPVACQFLVYTPVVSYYGTIDSFKWSFPLGFPSSSLDSFPSNIMYSVPSGQTLLRDTASLTILGPCGQQIFKIPITVYGDVTVSFDVIPTVCKNDPPFIIPVSPGPGGSFSSPTLNQDALNPSTGLFDPLYAPPGVHLIQYNFAPPGAPPGCTSSGQDSILVQPVPSLTLTVPSQVCIDGGIQTLSASLSPVMWTGSGITDSSNGIFDPLAAGTGNSFVSCEYTDPVTGCKVSDSTTIQVIGIPDLSVADTIFSCFISGSVNLNELANPIGSPLDGNTTWSDPENLVNPLTGDFSSPSVGFFPATVHYSVQPGCDTSVNLVIKVDSFVQPQVFSEPVLCKSLGTFTLSASPGMGRWGGEEIDTETGVINLTQLDPGDYTYTYTIRPGTPCEAIAFDTIRVVDEGVSAGPDQYVCSTQNQLVLSGGSPGTGEYIGEGITGNTIDITQLIPDSTYIYTYTVPTLPEACNRDELSVTVTTPPSAGFTLTRDTACIGNSVSILPEASGGVTFFIDWGDGSSGSNLTHVYQTAGTFSIELTVSTPNPLLPGTLLCSSNGTAAIHIIQPINPDQIGFDFLSDNSGCGPLEVIFKNTSQVENGHFSWDFGNGQTFIGYQPNPIIFQPGQEDTVYTVCLMVDTGCETFIFSQSVTVFPHPSANFGITYLEPCSGGILEASVLSIGNPESNTFYTSTGVQVDGSLTQSSFFQFYTGAEPDTVGIWLVTSNFCGADTAFQEVVVQPTDVVALIGLPDTTAICAGAAAQFINYSTTGVPFSWTASDGNTYGGDTIQIQFIEAGQYYLTVYAFGCGYDSMTVPIRVLPLPSLDVVHDLNKCPGDPLSFTVDSDAPEIVLWYGDGDSTNQKNSTHFLGVPGVYNPNALAVSDRGCRREWSGQFTILIPPEAIILAEDSVCVDAPLAFVNAGNPETVTCTWNFGDGNLSDFCQPTHTYEQPGLFSVILTAISQVGCRGADTLPIYVRTKPDAGFAYSIIEPCSPALVSFSGNSLNATGIRWRLGDGTTSNLTEFQHTYDAGGEYAVWLIATNEGICADTAIRNLKLFQTPEMDLGLLIHCMKADGIDLTVNSGEDNLVTVIGPDYAQTGDFHPGLPQGTYEIEIQSPDGCLKDSSIFLLAPDELILNAIPDSVSLRMGDSIQIKTIVNQTGVTFSWSPEKYLNQTDIANPVSRPHRTIKYVVTATDKRGCSKIDSILMDVRIDRDSGLFIPNAFTPNNDNINDLFYVRSSNPGIVKYEFFRVYDKYEEEVFDMDNFPGNDSPQPENPFFAWDGLFRGKKAEMGAYRYVIGIRYVDDIVQVFTGTLQLIR